MLSGGRIDGGRMTLIVGFVGPIEGPRIWGEKEGEGEGGMDRLLEGEFDWEAEPPERELDDEGLEEGVLEIEGVGDAEAEKEGEGVLDIEGVGDAEAEKGEESV